MTGERGPTTRDRGAHVGPGSNPAPTWPNSANGAHGRPVGASVGPELDPHGRLADVFGRLAAVFGEAAQVCQELSQEQLAAGARSALMERVPDDSETRPFLTVNDVARVLQVDEKTVRAWRERGQLPPAVKIGGVIRWDAAGIDRWIAENREAER